ncbi:MAG: hypothetical protein ACXVW5_32300 [Solirubrobacteraceae bacterium]
MRVLLAVVGVVLAAPALILVGIAFGPVALLLAALIGTALVVVGVWEWVFDSPRQPPISRA